MELISIAIAIYLGVGAVFAILAGISLSLYEKDSSEDGKELKKLVSQVGLISKNPKLFILLNAVLFWPWVVSNIGNKK